MLQGSLRGCTSWITPETLTLQFGALRSISLQPMASNIPHSPAVEETQEPLEAIVGCVEFFLWRGERQGEFNVVFGFDIFFCRFAVLDDFPTVLRFLIDPNIPPLCRLWRFNHIVFYSVFWLHDVYKIVCKYFYRSCFINNSQFT